MLDPVHELERLGGLSGVLTTLARKDLPFITVHGNGGPYLTRYTLRKDPDGSRLLLHQFHRDDEDEEMHSHPWVGSGVILAGGYTEHRLTSNGIVTRDFKAGDVNRLEPNTYHRVELLGGVECWTLFCAGPKLVSWGFYNLKTGVKMPWRDFIQQKGLVPVE